MAESTISPEVQSAFGSLIFNDLPGMMNGKVGPKIDREAFRGEDEEQNGEDEQIPKIKLT